MIIMLLLKEETNITGDVIVVENQKNQKNPRNQKNQKNQRKQKQKQKKVENQEIKNKIKIFL
jgi:hypothetical protein